MPLACCNGYLPYYWRVSHSPYGLLFCSDTASYHGWCPHIVRGSSSIIQRHGHVYRSPTWGFACPCLSSGIPDPMMFNAVTFWSCWVKVATVLLRLAIVLHLDIMVSMPVVAVTRFMRASCVPFISFSLFACWYPPARVDTFCFLLYLSCAAWKCASKFAQIFLSRCLSSH